MMCTPRCAATSVILPLGLSRSASLPSRRKPLGLGPVALTFGSQRKDVSRFLLHASSCVYLLFVCLLHHSSLSSQLIPPRLDHSSQFHKHMHSIADSYGT